MPYLLIRVIVRFGRIWPTSPAACQVVPHVSLPCSTSSTSLSPRRARWYAVEQPAMPPPTITMREERGSGMVVHCRCVGTLLPEAAAGSGGLTRPAVDDPFSTAIEGERDELRRWFRDPRSRRQQGRLSRGVEEDDVV